MITQSSTVFKINMKRYIRQLIHISLNWCQLFSPSFVSFETFPCYTKQWNHIVLQKQRYTCCALFLHGRQVRKEKQNQPTLFNWKSHFEWQVSVFHNSRQMKLNFPFACRLFAFASLKLLLLRWLYPGCQFSYTRCSKDWVWTFHTWERFTKRCMSNSE